MSPPFIDGHPTPRHAFSNPVPPQKARAPQALRRPELRLPRPVLVANRTAPGFVPFKASDIVVRHAVRAHQSLHFRIGHGLAAPRTFHRLELLD